VGDDDPTQSHLDVYVTKAGRWNPDHGDLELPADWEFLPSGDAFVTRQVRAAGVFWVAWQPRGKNRPHRRKLGLYAPRSAIADAKEEAERTAERRSSKRDANARNRDRAEDRYRGEFVDAVLAWLDFRPEHADLAREIATAAADQAVVVGSGRVGRTKKLSIDERAALAARATIRHRLTDYDDRLAELDPFESEVDDLEYQQIRRAAHEAVDTFLDTHRRRESPA
jgi:hypothetical protein